MLIFLRASVAIATPLSTVYENSAPFRGGSSRSLPLPAPGDELLEAAPQVRLRREAEDFARPARIAVAPRGQRPYGLRLALDTDVAPGELEEEHGQLAHARLDATAHVHDRVGRFCRAGEQVRACDVVGVYEVCGRRAIAVEHE